METTKILMSRNNPEGFKLEELLADVQVDIEVKTNMIRDSTSVPAQTIVQHNNQIIGLLKQAEALQRITYIMLGELGEDQGVTGKPRI